VTPPFYFYIKEVGLPAINNTLCINSKLLSIQEAFYIPTGSLRLSTYSKACFVYIEELKHPVIINTRATNSSYEKQYKSRIQSLIQKVFKCKLRCLGGADSKYHSHVTFTIINLFQFKVNNGRTK